MGPESQLEGARPQLGVVAAAAIDSHHDLN